MTITLNELQRLKEKKLKNMKNKEIEKYIERNVAYYYSHYSYDILDVRKLSEDEVKKNNENAKYFWNAFNDNIEIILNNIKEDRKMDNITKAANVNYIVSTLNRCCFENLNADHIKHVDSISEWIDIICDRWHFERNVYVMIGMFVNYVSTAYSLFHHCKHLLLVMFTIVSSDGIDDFSFGMINTSFKNMFLEFHMNYVRCKSAFNSIDYIEKDFLDAMFDSVEMKKHFDDHVEMLHELDIMFHDLIKDFDLFSYPKQLYAKKDFFDVDVVYDLKQFDIDYSINNSFDVFDDVTVHSDSFDGLFDDVDVDVSDEFKQMITVEKKYDIHIISDPDVSGGGRCTGLADVTGARNRTAIENVDEDNVDELEDLLL